MTLSSSSKHPTDQYFCLREERIVFSYQYGKNEKSCISLLLFRFSALSLGAIIKLSVWHNYTFGMALLNYNYFNCIQTLFRRSMSFITNGVAIFIIVLYRFHFNNLFYYFCFCHFVRVTLPFKSNINFCLFLRYALKAFAFLISCTQVCRTSGSMTIPA